MHIHVCMYTWDIYRIYIYTIYIEFWCTYVCTCLCIYTYTTVYLLILYFPMENIVHCSIFSTLVLYLYLADHLTGYFQQSLEFVWILPVCGFTIEKDVYINVLGNDHLLFSLAVTRSLSFVCLILFFIHFSTTLGFCFFFFFVNYCSTLCLSNVRFLDVQLACTIDTTVCSGSLCNIFFFFFSLCDRSVQINIKTAQHEVK